MMDQNERDDLFRRLVVAVEGLQNQLQTLSQPAAPGTASEVAAALARSEMLRGEMVAMARLIADTQAEVAGLGQAAKGPVPIGTAANELSGVINQTASAVGNIMDAAERATVVVEKLRALGELPPEMQEQVAALEAAQTEILIACSFQDLTGQRLRKIANVLAFVEERVAALVALWVAPEAGAAPAPKPSPSAAVVPQMPQDTRPDAHLMQGPRDNPISQEDVDNLFD